MSPLIAAAATALLHAALIGVAVSWLSANRTQQELPNALAVKILPEQPLAPPSPPSPPAAPVAEANPAPAPAIEEKPRPRPKQRKRDSSQPVAPKKQDRATPANPAQDPSPDITPSAPSTPAAVAPAAPAASQAAPPVATPPAAPTRTRASDANYAAGNRRPTYPRLSLMNNEEGTVLLRVLVKADGTAGAVEVKKSSGYPLLDKSASTAVQTWRFSPATVDGKPVDEWYEVPIPFKLPNN